MTSSLTRAQVEIDGQTVPVKVYRERRPNVRASVGKQAAILRMPLLLMPGDEQRHWQWFNDWLRVQWAKNAQLRQRFTAHSYQNGDVLHVGERSYHLIVKEVDRKQHSAQLRRGIIHLELASHADTRNRQKSIKTLLSRVVAQDYLPEITRRVRELNRLYFNQPINGVRLKYNHSNWGSCSQNGNINLSTRLLFAPAAVVDYVIIHELAHLIELNHSDRFWKLVSDAMPEYRQYERWLKANGAKCDFIIERERRGM